MKNDSPYFKQAALMLRVMPLVAEEECFALKGGTAINFFVRDMPRLSVDIDLTYLPLEDRATSLKNIGSALSRISTAVRKALNYKVQEKRAKGDQRITKLEVTDGTDSVVIEPNEILRGSVFGTKELTVSKSVEDTFEMSVTMNVLSFADLYGGKLCAALDRQHPRDIFDMNLLLENEGVTDDVRRAFVIYLSGHDRPIHELLKPTLKDFKELFNGEFIGMQESPISYEALVATRQKYIALFPKILTDAERKFLISIKSATPNWALMNLPGIEKLPALQWKLRNVAQMDDKKKKTMLAKLETILNG